MLFFRHYIFIEPSSGTFCRDDRPGTLFYLAGLALCNEGRQDAMERVKDKKGITELQANVCQSQ